MMNMAVLTEKLDGLIELKTKIKPPKSTLFDWQLKLAKCQALTWTLTRHHCPAGRGGKWCAVWGESLGCWYKWSSWTREWRGLRRMRNWVCGSSLRLRRGGWRALLRRVVDLWSLWCHRGASHWVVLSYCRQLVLWRDWPSAISSSRLRSCRENKRF